MRISNKNDEITKKLINKLRLKIIEAIKSMINDYDFLYNEKEIKELNNTIIWISSNQTIEAINEVEEQLKNLVYRTWQYEEGLENYYVHWLKKEKINTSSPVISTTFGNVDSFCNSVIGIKYKVNSLGFIGACEKDAAIVIENGDKQSIYTIKTLEDGRVVNSYNLCSPIITPKQTMNSQNNDYQSKHNEIILDARFVTPIEIVCIDEKYIDIATKISDKYNIPFSIEKTKKHL